MAEQPTIRIPWLRVVIEGVVIVFSVLLALAADAWWDGRQERQAEGDYLARIAADLGETRQHVLENAQRYEILLRHGKAVQPIFARTEDLPADTLGFVSSAFQASRVTDPVVARGAYDDLISTGNLRIIRNDSLRYGLSRFYANVENQLSPVDFAADQERYRATVRSLIPLDLQLFLREACLDDPPLTCALRPTASGVGAVAQDLVAAPAIGRDLNLSMQAKANRLGSVLSQSGFAAGFGEVVEEIDYLLAILDDEMGF